jgi:ATP-dependent DNA helicase DinG
MATRARDILGPDGPLARHLPGYEPREAQLAMADAVERALEGDRKLVCEAGTGTGKTLAYLVPAILSGRKVVVSTATKALQEQIFTKDLPLLARYAGLSTPAVLVKGLSNYLCRRRYSEFRASPEALRPSVASSLAAVERWVERTETGDLAELDALSETDATRAEIASSSETRIGAGCPFFSECFVTRMKREAEDAMLLVVNHHLFFADLALKGPFEGGALPPYDVVVFDEAHQIEDIAAEFFGVRVSSARVESLLRDADRAFVAAGLAESTPAVWRSKPRSAARRARASAPAASSGLGGGAPEGGALVDSARSASTRFFAGLAARGEPEGGRQPLDAAGWPASQTEAYHRCDAALEAVGALAGASDNAEALEIVARRTRQIRDDLAEIIEGARRRVTWVELGPRSVSIGCSPVNVASILSGQLFDVVPAVALTSATLTTSRGFAFFRERVGLGDRQGPVDELSVPSPFDYGGNALLYIPRDLPETQHPRFLAEAGDRVAELVGLSGGGAFVLCTSVRSMRALHARLARRPGGQPGPLLMQGEAPKTALLERFRASTTAVLVATMSFWEGVDVPGRALRLVVIDKLPFPVPSDPLVAARTAAMEDTGENPFLAYHVPTAAITLKQGFGRLIRTATDRGVVALLDGRVLTRAYGSLLLEPLPPATVSEWIRDVEEFYVRDRHPDLT